VRTGAAAPAAANAVGQPTAEGVVAGVQVRRAAAVAAAGLPRAGGLPVGALAAFGVLVALAGLVCRRAAR
jgi:hypothetical protein